MTHALDLARACSLLLAILIGLCGLALFAFHLLDKIVTWMSQLIGFWPFLVDAIWKYARSLDDKDRTNRGGKPE